ncbi:MAG: UbiA family prenyltransferase [Deltaproteobacteria bacterium]|nr:UbiA family prenyltransferase [Deltaproteobacteria bacterium]
MSRSEQSATRPGPVRRALALLAELTKVRITIMVTLTTVTGFLLGPAAAWGESLLWALLGTFVLSAGASALNHVQDARVDARMKRTAQRPIPGGRISRAGALYLAVLLSLGGLALLASIPQHGNLAALLGVAALLCYNAVYTPLKRVTAFAVIPGAVIGALPPLIGFVAAGGSLLDPYIGLVAVFFFLWQVPHFWLLLLMFGEQYTDAGLPSLSTKLGRERLARLTALWSLSTAVAGVAVAVAAFSPLAPVLQVVLIVASVWLALRSLRLLGSAPLQRGDAGRAFGRINVYALVMMACLSSSALF